MEITFASSGVDNLKDQTEGDLTVIRKWNKLAFKTSNKAKAAELNHINYMYQVKFTWPLQFSWYGSSEVG